MSFRSALALLRTANCLLSTSSLMRRLPDRGGGPLNNESGRDE